MSSEKKDPAVLFFIDKWLVATAEMDSDVRGWYLNLILHCYDKKSLPDDIEKLASLAGVKFSEYERFKQMLNQVLLNKFTKNDQNGRLENKFALKILKSREEYKSKRERSGNMGVVIKLAKTINGFTDFYINQLKKDLFIYTDYEIIQAKNKQVLTDLLSIYINRNTNNVLDSTSLIKTDCNTNTEEVFSKIENGFNQFPLPEHFNGCPEITLGSVKQLVKVTQKVDVSDDEIKSLWVIFKNQNLTGRKFYQNKSDVHSHFINWSKIQKFTNGNWKISNGNKKPNNSYSRAESGAAKAADELSADIESLL